MHFIFVQRFLRNSKTLYMKIKVIKTRDTNTGQLHYMSPVITTQDSAQRRTLVTHQTIDALMV